MSEELPLRDKDRVVLQKIQEGYDDIQKITSETTLENHEVNYCFTKLEDLDLITVRKPEGYTERVVDGQKRVFKAPKKAVLTEEARHQINVSQVQSNDIYQIMSHRELVERICNLENRVSKLESSIRILREQTQRQR